MNEAREPKNKYLMFKNYIHNELGITKEDIVVWIKESIQDIVKDLTNQAYGKFSLEQAVKNALIEHDKYWYDKNELKKEFKEMVVRELTKNIKLDVIVEGDKNDK